MTPYKDMPFPWTSKSKLKARGYCDYSFYLKYVKKEHQPKREDAVEGTNLHMVFANFFKTLTKEHCFKDEFTDARTELSKHPFRRFIYEACMQFVKPEHRVWGKYKNVINNFATIECKRWLRLNTVLHNKQEIFDCFKPIAIEKRLEHKATHLFGTIDRINVEVMPDGSKKIAIYDYKTGNVPMAIQNHQETGNMFDWDLRTDLMREVHFYGLLYLLCAGWQLSDKILEFINDEKWWYIKKNDKSYKESLKDKGKYLTSLGKDYKIFKEGKILKKGTIIVGFYFLNGDSGYRPIKEYNYSSHKGVLQATNDYRSIWHNKYFVKHPGYVFHPDGCRYKKCARYDTCQEEVVLFNKLKREGKI